VASKIAAASRGRIALVETAAKLPAVDGQALHSLAPGEAYPALQCKRCNSISILT